MTFTIGAGNDLCCAAIEQLGRLLVGRDIEDREELRELVFNALGWTAAAAIATVLLAAAFLLLLTVNAIQAWQLRYADRGR